jgi:hypothetical protein
MELCEAIYQEHKKHSIREEKFVDIISIYKKLSKELKMLIDPGEFNLKILKS